MRQPTNLDKHIVRRHFDRYANEYDQHAKVQIVLVEKLMQYVNEIWPASGAPERILEIGSGTGLLTLELLRRFPDAKITAVELSPAMIQVSRDKLGSLLGDRANNVFFIENDAEQVTQITADHHEAFQKPYDLIISSAVFQWFNHPFTTIPAYSHYLRSGGVMAFSTLATDTFYELHRSFAKAEETLNVASVRRGQYFLGKQDWNRIFSQMRGEFHWYEQHQTYYFPTVRNFLYAIKRIGAANAPAERKFIGRRLLECMEQKYVENFSSPQGIQATYHTGYGIWQKSY